MAHTENLEKELHHVWRSVTEGQVTVIGASDTALVKGMALLGLAVIRLDKTSSRLAKINIVLAVALLLGGVAQIILMVRGH